jgi:regulator of sigma E protease
MLTSIVAAVVILGLLIIVHEAGHFMMAKRLGVRVLRFSIGYPPKVWGIRRGETEYAIGATLLGGYVRMLGDEVGDEPKSEEIEIYLKEIAFDLIGAAREAGALASRDEPDHQLVALAGRIAGDGRRAAAAGAGDGVSTGRGDGAGAVLGRALEPVEALLLDEVRDAGSAERARSVLSTNPPPALLDSFRKRAFPSQKLWRRFAIVLGGPLANILFAPVLLAVVLMYGVPFLLPTIGKVSPGMPAARAGLTPGDRIVAINGHPMESWMDFSDTVKSGGGAPIVLEVEHGQGGELTRRAVTITPQRHEEKTVYGTEVQQWIIGVLPRGDKAIRKVGPITAVHEGVVDSVGMMGQLADGIGQIISGAIPARQALGGPIMIAQMAGQEAHQGLASAAMFMVMLSLELGLINLLPVPLLDGGHLLFFVFEGVRGKPLELRHREIALQVGLFILVALMAFVIFNDISRIVQG